MDMLENKVRGCLYGGAIGDALGAPAEGHMPEEIHQRYGWIEDFVEPWTGPSQSGKGDGRFTDDTHMVALLSRIYIEANDHLDPFRFARAIVPLIADEPRWIAEYGRELPLIDRLFYPEKWLLIRLRLANADPRLGGVGNMVNCGAAMYAAPVGLVNACDPQEAYREAIEVFAAHQWSYGLEAAGVMAACVAEAMSPTATVESVLAVALDVARDGTRAAIEAVVSAARPLNDWRDAIHPLRNAIRPFDGAAEEFHDRGNGSDDWRPSRTHSIEELPIALGMLAVTGADFGEAIAGGANYGRDCDSIASMAGAIAGALHGESAIPETWRTQVDRANRSDIGQAGSDLSRVVRALQRQQQARVAQRAEAFDMLSGQPRSQPSDSGHGRHRTEKGEHERTLAS